MNCYNISNSTNAEMIEQFNGSEITVTLNKKRHCKNENTNNKNSKSISSIDIKTA